MCWNGVVSDFSTCIYARATGLVECLLYLDHHKRPTTVLVDPECRMTVGSLSMTDLNMMVLA